MSPINRRGFLKQIGTCVSAAALIPYVPQLPTKNKEQMVWVEGLIRNRAIFVPFNDLLTFVDIFNTNLDQGYSILNKRYGGNGQHSCNHDLSYSCSICLNEEHIISAEANHRIPILGFAIVHRRYGQWHSEKAQRRSWIIKHRRYIKGKLYFTAPIMAAQSRLNVVPNKDWFDNTIEVDVSLSNT